MNERNSTAGLVAADTSGKGDHFERLRLIAAKLGLAKTLLQHRVTHETQEACKFIQEVEALLGIEEVEAPSEGLEGSQGVDEEDSREA